MFPKKRKQKEHNLNPSKISRKDNPKIPPVDSFIMPSIVNWNDTSDKSTKNSSQYTKAPSPTSKPLSPPPIDLSRLDEYANLASTSTLDWQETENFITQNSLIQQIPKPISPPPIDLSRLDEYANLASTSTLDWQETENFINQSLLEKTQFDNHPPPKPPPIISVFNANNPMVSITTPQTSNNENQTKQNIITHNSEDDDDDDFDNYDDRDLTSDDIFKIMMHISESSNSLAPLDIDIFTPVKTNIKDIEVLVNNFNVNIKIINDESCTKNQLSGYRSDKRKLVVNLCSVIKKTYPLIYPAKQILSLIQSDWNNLSCIPILDHEKDLRSLLFLHKKHLSEYSCSIPKKQETAELRKDIIRASIYNIEECFKRIYKLE